MKKNLTKIAAVASLATVLAPAVASANTVSGDIDHALRLEQTAHADGTQNDRIDWTGETNTNLKDSGGYVYGAGTKVARSTQQGNYWLYLAETGTGAVHYGEVPQQYVTPTGQVTNHLDDYGSTVVINNSLRSNDSMAGELTPTNDAATQTGSNNNYQEGNNSASSSTSSSQAQPGHDASGAVTGNQGAASSSSASSQAKPSTSVADGSTSATGSTAATNSQPGHDVSGAVTGTTSSSTSSASSSSQAQPGHDASGAVTGTASSSSQAKPSGSVSSEKPAAGQASSSSQSGHDISGAVTGVAGNHDNGGATASSSSSQKPAAGQASQAKPGEKPAKDADKTDAKKTTDVKVDHAKADAGKTAGKAETGKAQAGHHVVAAGETLSGIAQANGTTVGAIVKANPSITNPASVKVGTDLVMPAANGGQAATQSVAKAAPAATSQAQTSQAKSSEKAAPAKGELLKTGAQDNEKGAVIASMAAVGGLVGLAALNRKKKFNY